MFGFLEIVDNRQLLWNYNSIIQHFTIKVNFGFYALWLLCCVNLLCFNVGTLIKTTHQLYNICFDSFGWLSLGISILCALWVGLTGNFQGIREGDFLWGIGDAFIWIRSTNWLIVSLGVYYWGTRRLHFLILHSKVLK